MSFLVHSHRGSALLIALVLTILMTILTLSFLEKVYNLSRTTGGIENSAEAYALTTGLIEQQLIDPSVTGRTPWNIKGTGSTNGLNGTLATGSSLVVYTGANIIPIRGKGNSPFDPNWNTIGIGNPAQIVIPSGVIWNSVSFRFRVPTISTTMAATGAANIGSGIILWTFGYTGASLYASGETNVFKGSQIDGQGKNITNLSASSTAGFTNTGVAMTFQSFYDTYQSKCGAAPNYNCTIKLSMIRPFQTIGGQTFSTLEYQIDFSGVNPPITVPNQYMVLDASAYVRGFLRSRQIRIQQLTTNTTADFAVLQ